MATIRSPLPQRDPHHVLRSRRRSGSVRWANPTTSFTRRRPDRSASSSSVRLDMMGSLQCSSEEYDNYNDRTSRPVLSWLKVASSRRFLVSSKPDFVLRGNRFTGYKKESMTQQVGAEGSTIFIKNVKIEISDPRNLMFIITTPELSKAGQEAHPYGDVDKGVQQVDYGSSSHGIAEFETDNTQINSS
ncbi:hypothetical protein F443_13724, partial [Phytophthora nicotianae P1569]